MFFSALQQLGTYALSIVLAIVAFYLSLLATSLPPARYERAAIDRAIALLAAKGFDQEVWLLRKTATFRGTDHWLNSFVPKGSAYASTNFPFQIVTVYPDFVHKTADDTERAVVLLHEARHLMGEDEHAAYAYVWRQRARLGWAYATHSDSETFATVEQHTRENAPELFNCPEKPWEDCTEETIAPIVRPHTNIKRARTRY